MELIDIYLKAGSKSAMISSLNAAGFSQDPDSGALYHPDAALDVIGTIRKSTGDKVIVDGVEQDVLVDVTGYYVNVRTTSQELVAALDTLRTYPETPVRVWS